MTLLNALRT